MITRPNFILLVGEDAGRALHCYGDPDANTPNLDRFASEGCRFDNAFSTAPVCSPSRSTLVSGRYAWTLGNHHHRSNLLQPPRLFTHELRDAGYHVNWANKLDFNFTPDDDFADQRQEWFEDLENGALPNQPFFLYHNFTVTHESTMWSADEKRFGGHNKERLAKEHLLSPDQAVDPDSVHVPAYLPDTPAVRQNIARFYEAQSIADAEIGRVLRSLDSSPYKENTIVIYLTDHGRGLLREKRWCYDAGLHLSLIVRGPGITTPGSVSDELVSWVDIAPTILSLAGVPIPGDYQGQIFLGPQKASPRTHAFAGRDRLDEAFDYCRSVRSKDYHYIRNRFPELPYAQRMWYLEIMETTREARRLAENGSLAGSEALFMQPTKPAEELYDVEVDPEMIHNLADDPSLATIKADLSEALDENLQRWGDLGLRPERELIDQGIIDDALKDMHAKVEKLPKA
ncbi:MAG: sulfatase family protein, partial [Puniceicoccales bacterium]